MFTHLPEHQTFYFTTCRNDKREVDNTQKIYLIDAALAIVAYYGSLMHFCSLLKRQIHNKGNKTTLTLI